MNGIIQYLSSCFSFTSLDIVPLWFIHNSVCQNFLFMAELILYHVGGIPLCWSVHPLDTWVAPTSWLPWGVLLCTRVYGLLFWVPAFTLLVYPEVVLGLLDHKVFDIYLFKEPGNFSTAATPHSYQQYTRFRFLHGTNTFLFDYSHPGRCEVVYHCGFGLHFPHD